MALTELQKQINSRIHHTKQLSTKTLNKERVVYNVINGNTSLKSNIKTLNDVEFVVNMLYMSKDELDIKLIEIQEQLSTLKRIIEDVFICGNTQNIDSILETNRQICWIRNKIYESYTEMGIEGY